ncbi:MAG: TetR/AcrR family transcriptional regulator [Armatimonadota bacterium]
MLTHIFVYIAKKVKGDQLPTPKRADRKEQILSAAMEVFAELGFERATTRAIARRAGVAEGTIFNYFATKRDILVCALEQHILETIPHFVLSDDVETMMRKLIGNRLQMWKDHSGILRVMISEAIFDDEFRDLYRSRIYTPAMQKLNECVTQQRLQGHFVDVEPAIVSRMMMGVALGFGLMNPVAGEVDDIEGLSIKLTKVLLQGLLPRE